MAIQTASSGDSILQPMSSESELLARVESLREAELDELPFGMIQLDAKGNILKFNKTEARLARIDQAAQVGKNFFEHVAPCTRVKEFQGRFVEGVARRQLYETFGFVFKFKHGWRNVAITLFFSEKTQSVWVLVSQKTANSPSEGGFGQPVVP